MKFCRLFFILCNFLTIWWFKVGIVMGIIGGKEVSDNECKYTVSIQADNEHICGGSIIGKQHILTAAHCVIGKDNNFKNNIFSIIAGVTKLQDDNSQSSEVEIIYVPEKFSYATYKLDYTNHLDFYSGPTEDLAILKLKNNLILSENTKLKQLLLPRREAPGRHYLRYFKKKATVTGFGDSSIGRGIKRNYENVEISKKNNGILKNIEVIILHQTSCKSIFQHSDIDNKHICAQVNIADKNVQEGICHGDDGGPLVYKEKTIIGVLAKQRMDCDERLGPAIYIKVSSFLSFINDVINDKDLTNVRIAAYKKRSIEVGNSSREKDLVEVTQFLKNSLQQI